MCFSPQPIFTIVVTNKCFHINYMVSQNIVSTFFLLYPQLKLHLGIKVSIYLKSKRNSLLEKVQKLFIAPHINQNILWWSWRIHYQKWQIYFIICLDSCFLPFILSFFVFILWSLILAMLFSSYEVVFLWGNLHLTSSSCKVFFLCSHLPVR